MFKYTWRGSRQKTKTACFSCRQSFKGYHDKCPSCGGIVYDVGPKFKAPPKRDVKEWEIMRIWWIDTRAIRGRNGIWLGQGPKQKTVNAQLRQFVKEREYSHNHSIESRRFRYHKPPYVTFK